MGLQAQEDVVISNRVQVEHTPFSPVEAVQQGQKERFNKRNRSGSIVIQEYLGV